MIRFSYVSSAAMLLALAAPGTRGAQSQAPTPATLSLGEAARLAARNTAQVEVARVGVDAAQSVVHQRQADLRPNYSATALQSGRTFNTVTFGLNFPSAPGEPPLFDPRGQVEGPVNTLDVRGHIDASIIDKAAHERVRQAQASVDAASANVTSVGDEAAGQAAAAYLQVLRAQSELDARSSDSLLADQLLGIARDQLTAGTGIALDVTRAQTQLASIRSQLIVARANRDRARLVLLRAVGLSLDSPVQLTDSLVGLSMPDSLPNEAAALALATRRRSDILSIEQQIGAVHQQEVAIRAERLPTLGLFADDGWIGGNALHLLPTYTYGIQFSVPVLNGARRAGQLEQQTAAAQQLEVREHDLRDEVALDVRSALVDMGSAREQVAAARDQLALGQQEVTQARDRFAAGVAGNADVISAMLSLTQAKMQLVDALAVYQNARVALARAEGTVTDLQ